MLNELKNVIESVIKLENYVLLINNTFETITIKFTYFDNEPMFYFQFEDFGESDIFHNIEDLIKHIEFYFGLNNDYTIKIKKGN